MEGCGGNGEKRQPNDNQMVTKAQSIEKPNGEEDSMEQSWSSRCAESIKREKLEAEKKYGIRIGQTDIRCARCGQSWGFGKHICQDIRFKQLEEKEQKERETLKARANDLLGRVRKIGAKKLSTISFDGETGSFISRNAVSKWIQKGNIPFRHIDRISQLVKTVV
jgi:hypothetical protein